MKKTLCILFLGYCTVVNTYAQTLASVTSPDGSIVLQINGKDNNLSYNVKKGGNTVLVEAPISMTIDQTEICCGISVLSSDTYKTDATYPIRGSHSLAIDKSNGLLLRLKNRQLNTDFTLEARSYNDGIAFRMILPGNKNQAEYQMSILFLLFQRRVWSGIMICIVIMKEFIKRKTFLK